MSPTDIADLVQGCVWGVLFICGAVVWCVWICKNL